jgi:hypothetical protein
VALNTLDKLDTKTYITGFYDTWPEAADSVRTHLFGVLVDLTVGALPGTTTLMEFRSDLFRDAQWLTENVNGPMTFPFMVRHSGTQLGDKWVQAALNGRSAGTVYDIALTEERGAYYVTVTKRGEFG